MKTTVDQAAQSAIAAPALHANFQRRIMDPIHGLIEFNNNEIDKIAWQLIDTAPFQRLRRIRQLGFSEFVFPGATHTRFSHSIGVFHNARRLVGVIKRLGAKEDKAREFQTCIAALLHDIGHGPHSHTFEKVSKTILGDKAKRHESWSAEIITNPDGPIVRVLGSDRAKQIADGLKKKDPSDIYDSIVSSQFDADRIDYLVRDRYMTGVELGRFDLEWLFDTIRVGKITLGHADEDDPVSVDGLYLSEKGIRAAEGYLIARFHMYEQVYLHKATRGMELMLQRLLQDLANKYSGDHKSLVRLLGMSPLTDMLGGKCPSTMDYLRLDDGHMQGAVAKIISEPCKIGELAGRIWDRKLYKCVDVARTQHVQNRDVLMKFKRAVTGFKRDNGGVVVLQDDTVLSPYKLHGYDEPGALQKVLVGGDSGADTNPQDVKYRSKIVAALEDVPVYRVYVENSETKSLITELLRSATNGQ